MNSPKTDQIKAVGKDVTNQKKNIPCVQVKCGVQLKSSDTNTCLLM